MSASLCNEAHEPVQRHIFDNIHDKLNVFTLKSLSHVFDRVRNASLVFYGTAILIITFAGCVSAVLVRELCYKPFLRNFPKIFRKATFVWKSD